MIVPTFNGAEHIGEQLSALVSQRTSRRWELIVVDGGSSDGTLALVDEYRAGSVPITIVELSGGPGVNAGINAGVRATNAALIAIAEHDDVAAPDWLEQIASGLADHELVGSTIEKHRLNDAAVVPSRRRFPEDLPPGIPMVDSTGMGFTRRLWAELGGFDESYRYGGNDAEFCYRAHQAGITAVRCEHAVMHYRIRSDWRAAFRQARSYGLSSVRAYDQFGSTYVPRRAFRMTIRDWARIIAWCPRARGDNRYRHLVAYRLGLQVGYFTGSARYRRVFF